MFDWWTQIDQKSVLCWRELMWNGAYLKMFFSLSPFCSSVLEPDLNSSFGQIDACGKLFPKRKKMLIQDILTAKTSQKTAKISQKQLKSAKNS